MGERKEGRWFVCCCCSSITQLLKLSEMFQWYQWYGLAHKELTLSLSIAIEHTLQPPHSHCSHTAKPDKAVRVCVLVYCVESA